MNIYFKKEQSSPGVLNGLIGKSRKKWGYSDEFINKIIETFGFSEENIENSSVTTAYHEETPIGFYSYSRENDAYVLEHFVLDPKYTGISLGRKMWEHFLLEMKNKKCTEIILYSDPNAAGFYEHMGCEKIGTKKSPISENILPIFRIFL